MLATTIVSLVLAAEPIHPALPVDDAAVKAVAALKPNEGRVIGKARVVGEFNDTARKYDLHKTGPRGRDFTIRMVWAPERKRALFCGANHGVPHRLNDVWEFDLSAMTWAMLYAPDLPRDYGGLGKDASDVEFKDGTFITKRGGPGIIAHTWWGLTYDPERKAMLFMNTWVTDRKKAAQTLGGDPAKLYPGPPLWSFTPQTATWKALQTDPPYPRAIFGGMLEYVPELKGTLWHANNWQMHGTWLYDGHKNAWRDLKANEGGAFESESPAPEQVGYYDPKRKQIIVQRHRDTFHYDVATNAWKKVLTRDKDATDVPMGHDARAPMDHNPATGQGMLIEFPSGTLWSYDPERIRWTKLEPTGDPLPRGSKPLAYFDPHLGVFVVILDTTVWAYRS